jgi:hypothetical protein
MRKRTRFQMGKASEVMEKGQKIVTHRVVLPSLKGSQLVLKLRLRLLLACKLPLHPSSIFYAKSVVKDLSDVFQGHTIDLRVVEIYGARFNIVNMGLILEIQQPRN